MSKVLIHLIVGAGCELEAESIEKFLEVYEFDIIKTRLSRNDDFKKILDGTNIFETTEILILCLHGGDFDGEDVFISNQENGKYREEKLEKFSSNVNINDLNVISTACFTGNTRFSNLFLNAGAKSFLAPKEQIDVKKIIKDLCNFLYLFANNFSYCESIDATLNADWLFGKKGG